MKLLCLVVLVLPSCGCLLDSVEPWLSPETIVESDVAVDGAWSVVDEVALFGSETEVTLERKPATSRKDEFFYITIRPRDRNSQFIFCATVHEIEGLRFLQISNFTHFDQEVFSLANRPTYALWRVEADRDNIVIWMPGLPNEVGENLKTLKDQDDNLLFVDTAHNNESMLREWVKAYRNTDERPEKALMLALTRAGTEFALPPAVQQHLPALYEHAKQLEKEKSKPSDNPPTGDR